jgi:hypothetical protein
LREAARRGVKFQALVPRIPEARDFLEFVRALPSEFVEVRQPVERVHGTMFGIRGKEVLIYHKGIEKSVGIHYHADFMVDLVEPAFDKVWEKAVPHQ